MCHINGVTLYKFCNLLFYNMSKLLPMLKLMSYLCIDLFYGTWWALLSLLLLGKVRLFPFPGWEEERGTERIQLLAVLCTSGVLVLGWMIHTSDVLFISDSLRKSGNQNRSNSSRASKHRSRIFFLTGGPEKNFHFNPPFTNKKSETKKYYQFIQVIAQVSPGFAFCIGLSFPTSANLSQRPQE